MSIMENYSLHFTKMLNQYQQAKFAFSANAEKQLPPEALLEVAFVGRSNAGKSSALNTLTQQKNLARVSKTPGRTQLINYFHLPINGHYLVDLPGYGYADVPAHIQAHWQKLLGNYLLTRPQLAGVILLMDIRHPLKELDWQMIDCCHQRNVPVHILLTKADKLSKRQQSQQLRTVQKDLTDYSEVSIQMFSSLNKMGLEELIQKIDSWFDLDFANTPILS